MSNIKRSIEKKISRDHLKEKHIRYLNYVNEYYDEVKNKEVFRDFDQFTAEEMYKEIWYILSIEVLKDRAPNDRRSMVVQIKAPTYSSKKNIKKYIDVSPILDDAIRTPYKEKDFDYTISISRILKDEEKKDGVLCV